MQLHLQTIWSFKEAHAKAHYKNKQMKCLFLYLAPIWLSSFTKTEPEWKILGWIYETKISNIWTGVGHWEMWNRTPSLPWNTIPTFALRNWIAENDQSMIEMNKGQWFQCQHELQIKSRFCLFSFHFHRWWFTDFPRCALNFFLLISLFHLVMINWSGDLWEIYSIK